MANITQSSYSSPSLEVFEPDLSYIIIADIISITAIILNSIEIRLIWRKWRKATDFERLLFHLAISDLMNGIGVLAITSLLTYFYVTKTINFVYVWITFGVVGFFYFVSIKLVVIIGLERLLAIKLPLKHRLWHTSRKTLYVQTFVAWSLSAVTMTVALLIDYFVQITRVHNAKGQNNAGRNVKGQHVTISRSLAYAVATYTSCGVLAILIIYLLVCDFILKRVKNRFNFDKKDYQNDPKLMKLAMKKEKGTIIICRLVLVTFLVCNVPFIVAMYRGTVDQISANLTNLSAVTNPVIYFFKGYIERCYGKKKIVISSTESGGRSGGTTNQIENRPRTYDTAVEVGIVEKEANDDLSKSTDQEPRGLWGKSQGSSPLQSNSDTFEEMEFVTEDDNLDMPRSTDQEFRTSKVKGEVASSKQPKATLSLELGLVNTAATVNTSI